MHPSCSLPKPTTQHADIQPNIITKRACKTCRLIPIGPKKTYELRTRLDKETVQERRYSTARYDLFLVVQPCGFILGAAGEEKDG